MDEARRTTDVVEAESGVALVTAKLLACVAAETRLAESTRAETSERQNMARKGAD